jgi:hypothetical protein
MADPLRLLHAPLGGAGSGRVRYGAAMALYARGQLDAAQLEVYREAAAHDGRDPLAMLAACGLAPPPPLPPDAALDALFDQAATYLGTLAHPGAAEVRAALACRSGLPRARGKDHPGLRQWLAPALAALRMTHPTLALAIAEAAPLLPWRTYDSYPRAEIGEAFAAGHAYAPILGDGAPFQAAGVDFGLFLIAPQVLYRDHNHAAPELYAPLTGPHGWRFTPGARLVLKPAHQPVWNPSFRPHATKVGPVPFLAFFVWTRDVQEVARVLPADDWAELEGMSLG